MTNFSELDLSALARTMRADWDRRIGHDYRFWMSDGHRDDAAMWATGERDFSIVTSGLSGGPERTIVEIGCGVGRLLRAAGQRWGKVVGLDVSAEAINKAKQLLKEFPNVELLIGSGFDLQPIADSSVDCVFSFASLTSMPTDVTASYLCEAQRILRSDGDLRLQLYLGTPQIVSQLDTLHLRCYEHGNFTRAVQAAGFEVLAIEELKLPFQVSFDEINVKAVTVSLRKSGIASRSALEISKLLLPQGEPGGSDTTTRDDLEYWMTVNYAKELTERGDLTKARENLEYAARHCSNVSIDVQDTLSRIVSEIDSRSKPVVTTSASAAAVPASSEIFEKNLRVLADRFPLVHAKVTGFSGAPAEVRTTEQGPVVYVDGQCLDHPSKPKDAGRVWAQNNLNEPRAVGAEQIVIFGFGSGYHLEALAELAPDKVLGALEPSLAGFIGAIGARDLSGALSKLWFLSIGTDLSLPADVSKAEYFVRPQAQAIAGQAASELRSKFYGERGITALNPVIGVLGPLQGGTLPITGYTVRALLENHQRVRTYDVTGFTGAYHLFSQFVSDQTRQNTLQGHYIETVAQTILESTSEKPIDILIVMAQAPISGRVLNEFRKRGVITVLWFLEDYFRFTYWKDIAKFYDFVFCFQKGECIDLIKQAGAGEVHYVPAACDPLVHVPLQLSPEERQRWGSAVSFVGAGYHNRQQMFASLAHMPFKIWGTEWPTCRPFDKLVQEEGRRLSPEEYVKIFNATDVNLNLHSSTERDGVDPFGDFVNPRTFELAACGAFQLCDKRLLLPEVFEPGKEIVTFESTFEMKEKIAYYLEHPEERRQIAERSRARVLKDHTYTQRLKQMLSIIYASRFDHLKRRQDANPWTKIMELSKPHPELHRRAQMAMQRGEEPGLDAMVSDIVMGQGKLSETEQKLMFLFHVAKQIIRMKREDSES